MGYVIYVIDCETTGLDYQLNDVIEVSFWRISDGEQKTWCLKPLNISEISDKALKVNGHKKEDLLHATASGKETYREPSDVISEIEAWVISDGVPIEDRVFLGQNSDFDYKFLQNLWKKAGSPDTFPFGGFVVDTIQLTRLIDMCTGKKRKRYNLGSLVRDFGITKAKAHRAEGDVKMTKDLFLAQFNPIKDFIAENFKNSYTENE
jgi:DNA polymerase III alpha subunit (gram-positive type)